MAEIDNTRPLVFQINRYADLYFFISAFFFFCNMHYPSLGFPSMPSLWLYFMLRSLWKITGCEIRLYPDHFQTKLRPSMRRHSVFLYSEVVSAEEDGEVLDIYYTKHNTPGKTKRIEIPIDEMREEDRAIFIKTLRDRIILNRNRHPVAP